MRLARVIQRSCATFGGRGHRHMQIEKVVREREGGVGRSWPWRSHQSVTSPGRAPCARAVNLEQVDGAPRV
ncbi:hypothetical protein J6590_041793 [Homalodisca vitripennis]|nr:hypothetical protein J6590_041793 [Homalodisca vitripennis]